MVRVHAALTVEHVFHSSRNSVLRMCLMNGSDLEHCEGGVCWELLAGEYTVHEVAGVCFGLLE